jgi:hypothetical protein
MLLSGLALLFQSAGAAPGAPVVLSCSFPVAGASAAAPAARIFRVGPGSLQEWDAGLRQFGRNLCLPFACVRAAGRTEGSISSASVSYTVGVSDSGEAYWRAQGATGFAAKQGVCRVINPPNP